MKTLVVNESICSRCGRPGGECRCGGRRTVQHNVEDAVDRQSMELMTPEPMFPGDDERDAGHVSRDIIVNAVAGDGSELMGTEIDWSEWARQPKRPDRRTEPARERVTVNRRDGLTGVEALMIPPAF